MSYSVNDSLVTGCYISSVQDDFSCFIPGC